MAKAKRALHEKNSITLDHSTLGRPLHLLAGLNERLKNEVNTFLKSEFNHPYRAMLGVSQLSQSASKATPVQWLDLSLGHLAVEMSRPFLLRTLDYRYGAKAKPTAITEQDLSSEPSSTELRLKSSLANKLAGVFLAFLNQSQISPSPSVLHTDAVWQIDIEIVDQIDQQLGNICLVLNHALFDLLLKQVAKPRSNSKSQTAFFDQLKIKCHVHLAEKALTLDDVLKLKVGEIMPISLQARANVYIGKSKLFTASVAENNGALCLTSFEDAD
ncbi:FliM/FliN family flagellar motor switch protein [Iodobacter sp. CM08]|uniref:FliM/FliN family flagellar motor switch protein n=1 Tax=Iodobacter sp. CM08 TaxID=3085902 RepID=UPI0029818BF9|nr:FliM/FliN family flagellar motor switch protein [Iodobacter sp. CM08]MDW5417404.1 FliM/FliN family flagellar motor switch protein [Iodobacter sp. CM08]